MNNHEHKDVFIGQFTTEIKAINECMLLGISNHWIEEV